MKISKKSWHYKLYKSLHTLKEPSNVCEYIKIIALNLLRLSTASFLCIGLITTYLLGAYVAYQYGLFSEIPRTSLDYDKFDAFRSVFIVINFIILSVCLIGLYNIYLEYSRNKLYEKIKQNNYQELSKGFMHILWDKFKNKVCHKIEVV